ncbi:UNVERIFIED_CONTAM: hypothetical protein GTU68_000984 [Idotea baltica]|nr:hypothetical protein [Idotea baltica]
MLKMVPLLKKTLKVQLFNTGEGELNYMCGADYVKSNQRAPQGVPPTPNIRCASVDGDADRVVFSYSDGGGKFHLLDGDKIATLVAGYIKELVQKSGLELELGLVQTAYANGASTEYISRSLGVPVRCALTGVKHLHHAALAFDVGVYFEANGHGTVIFSPKARKEIQAQARGGSNPYARDLNSLMDLINETVGDAISDLLLVETVLLKKGWSAQDWDQAYQDLPNKLAKVTVKDRSVITTTDAERCCVTPLGLQDALNSLVGQYPRGRSFVRPSGTEDIVRVYAEAASQEHVLKLCSQVAQLVYDRAGGQGDRPTL